MLLEMLECFGGDSNMDALETSSSLLEPESCLLQKQAEIAGM